MNQKEELGRIPDTWGVRGAAMHLYSLTLQKSSGITAALYGNFSGARQQEIIVARCKVLELMRPDDNGKMQTVFVTDVFGIIRSIATCRLTGGNRDYIVLGTDSGKIVIVEYSADKCCFERVHAETFGKTGLRRTVPGQFVATDPRGRAVMMGAAEKQKLVYTLNRDSAARLTISSPLEAHKTNTLTFHMVGVDVGFDNPLFAALEVDMEEVENDQDTGEVLYEKNLVFYELDLGLNHVVRKWSDAGTVTFFKPCLAPPISSRTLFPPPPRASPSTRRSYHIHPPTHTRTYLTNHSPRAKPSPPD